MVAIRRLVMGMDPPHDSFIWADIPDPKHQDDIDRKKQDGMDGEQEEDVGDVEGV